MNSQLAKSPRLYVSGSLHSEHDVTLARDQVHYLSNVMRLEEGAFIRVFNGKDGEWSGVFNKTSKKEGYVALQDCLRAQPEQEPTKHLYFTPLKKNRLDFLIEKSVELGVTALTPVLTQNTDIRKINAERIRAQIIEACEQCERLTIPLLNKMVSFSDLLVLKNPLAVALERCEEAKEIPGTEFGSILIGPEGGFSEEERVLILKEEHFTPVSLGTRIFRAETAALSALIQMDS
ncbi:MAG: RNA methyltransferase [Micavibrio sp.]|nr:RNA methyltransferase [Micavibrio sp.]|tara:strand:+ start:151 stop:852 length:702 start_codon:yes stop_codon:yes gene_type:complete